MDCSQNTTVYFTFIEIGTLLKRKTTTRYIDHGSYEKKVTKKLIYNGWSKT